MCRFADECPSVDMECGRAMVCPLISDDDNAYVGPCTGFLFQQGGCEDEYDNVYHGNLQGLGRNH